MILYCHKRKLGINKFWKDCIEALGGTTVAIEQLKPWLLETLKVGEFLEKKVGISKCSDEDRYDKKIGRELAKSRMKLTRLTVVKIIQQDNYIRVDFVSDSNAVFKFIKYKSATEPFFTDYEEH